MITFFFALSVFFYSLATFFYPPLVFGKPLSRITPKLFLKFALLFHTLYIGALVLVHSATPHGALIFSTWLMVLLFIYLESRFRLESLGMFVSPLAFAGLSYAYTFSFKSPSQISFTGVWAKVHLPFIFSSYALLFLATASSIIYLLQEKILKQKNKHALFLRFPSLELVDTISYNLVIIGFPLLTLGLIAGILWQRSLKSPSIKSWDPKVVWAIFTWVIYLGYLNCRSVLNWKGRKSAYLLVFGFAVIVIGLFGVQHFLIQAAATHSP